MVDELVGEEELSRISYGQSKPGVEGGNTIINF
jgi:hypothetical protein